MNSKALTASGLQTLLQKPYPRFETRNGRMVLARSASLIVMLPSSERPVDLAAFLCAADTGVSRDYRIAQLREGGTDTDIVDVCELEALLRELPSTETSR